MCWQVKLCDPHLSALEVRFSRRGAIQIYTFTFTFTLSPYVDIPLSLGCMASVTPDLRLPSWPNGRYQFILLGKQWHTVCEQLSQSRYVEQNGRDLNLRPLGCTSSNSDALTTTPPCCGPPVSISLWGKPVDRIHKDDYKDPGKSHTQEEYYPKWGVIRRFNFSRTRFLNFLGLRRRFPLQWVPF